MRLKEGIRGAMVLNTRRRALGLLLAAAAAMRLPPLPQALAAKKDCFDSKAFGPWKAQATGRLAGARINEVQFTAKECDLRIEVQIAASFEGKIVVYGDAEKTRLPKKFLIDPENRLIAWSEDGKEVVNEPLCGNCTDIFDNKVSIVLPLACAPLFRANKSIDMAVRLAGKEECRFTLDGESLRQGLDWASERQASLAQAEADQTCTSPEGCFITSACCEALGLTDHCFELRALRRYRDEVLAKRPGGTEDILAYYRLAPLILARIPDAMRVRLLRTLYARYILPSAIAATFGFNALAYRLYAMMMRELTGSFAPEAAKSPSFSRLSQLGRGFAAIRPRWRRTRTLIFTPTRKSLLSPDSGATHAKTE
jgi:hypothetical protein